MAETIAKWSAYEQLCAKISLFSKGMVILDTEGLPLKPERLERANPNHLFLYDGVVYAYDERRG